MLQSNVNALIDLKLEKYKNLQEESRFYWREISDGTLKFNRRQCEVAVLKHLTKTDLLDFFNEHIRVGAPQKNSLSVQVYGSSHSSEYNMDKAELVEPGALQIEDVFSFKRSHPLFGSFKGGIGLVKL